MMMEISPAYSEVTLVKTKKPGLPGLFYFYDITL